MKIFFEMLIIIEIILFYFILFLSFFPLGLPPQHMEVPRLGVELELPAYATTTATWNTSRIFNLCHSSRQHGSLTH